MKPNINKLKMIYQDKLTVAEETEEYIIYKIEENGIIKKYKNDKLILYSDRTKTEQYFSISDRLEIEYKNEMLHGMRWSKIIVTRDNGEKFEYDPMLCKVVALKYVNEGNIKVGIQVYKDIKNIKMITEEGVINVRLRKEVQTVLSNTFRYLSIFEHKMYVFGEMVKGSYEISKAISVVDSLYGGEYYTNVVYVGSTIDTEVNNKRLESYNCGKHYLCDYGTRDRNKSFEMIVHRNKAEWRYDRCKNYVSENVGSQDEFIEIRIDNAASRRAEKRTWIKEALFKIDVFGNIKMRQVCKDSKE